jgi:hypothetical protein
MASTINADNGVVSGSSGVKTTADTSGVLALQSNGSTALSISTGLVTTLTNPLPVGSGGTGITTTPTAGAVPYGNGTTLAYTSAGTSGQVLTSAGSGAPTWSTVSSVPTFTATGTISAAGVSVALNSDGTVTQISGTSTSFSAGTGVATPNNRNGSNMAAAYDPVNQKTLVLVCYSSYVMGYVGTVSGSTISFGSEYQIFTAASQYVNVDYDTANAKFLVAASQSAGIRIVPISISGSTISIGTSTVLTSSSGWGSYVIPTVYNPQVGKFLILASNGADTTRMWVATISGTTVTENARYDTGYQSQAVVSGAAYNPSSGNVVTTYQSTVTSYRYQYVLPVSMSTSAPYATAGTSVILDSYDTGIYNVFACPIFIGSVTAGYTLVILYNTLGGVWAKAGSEIAGTVTLTSPVSVGSTLSTSRPFSGISNNAGANAAFIWVDGNDNNVKIATVFASPGQLPVFGAVNSIITTGDSGTSCGFSYNTSQSKSVAVYYTSATLRINSAVITNSGYATNAQSFIGFSTASASSGASVGVSMYANMNTNQSGLTLGSKYFVTYSGTVSTTNSGFPYAGKAYDTTKIFVGV